MSNKNVCSYVDLAEDLNEQDESKEHVMELNEDEFPAKSKDSGEYSFDESTRPSTRSSNYFEENLETSNFINEGESVRRRRESKRLMNKLECITLVTAMIGAVGAAIFVSICHEEMWPTTESVQDENNITSTKEPQVTLSPTISHSFQPTYTGYRDDTILPYLQSISPSLQSSMDLDDPSPQNQAARFVLYDDPIYLKADEAERIKQRYILTTFFYSTGGNHWNSHNSWLSGEAECNWQGISCNDNHIDYLSTSFVTKIDIRKNNLVGNLPSELSFLNNLTDVSFNDNNLIGSPFNVFIDMPFLKVLDLRNNEFNENLSSLIGRMPSLLFLYIEGNNFSGQIPSEIGLSSTLSVMTLHDNDFTG